MSISALSGVAVDKIQVPRQESGEGPRRRSTTARIVAASDARPISRKPHRLSFHHHDASGLGNYYPMPAEILCSSFVSIRLTRRNVYYAKSLFRQGFRAFVGPVGHNTVFSLSELGEVWVSVENRFSTANDVSPSTTSANPILSGAALSKIWEDPTVCRKLKGERLLSSQC